MNLIERMAGAEWFSKVGPKVVPHVDRFVHKITGGRVLLSGLYVPALMLTTTGRKSGLPRTVPIACFPHGDGFIVVGSNYGREHHPAWSSNLLANPEATVEYRGKTFGVKAHLASPDEKAELWPKIIKNWPHFDTYTARSGRDIRVFVLNRVQPG